MVHFISNSTTSRLQIKL